MAARTGVHSLCTANCEALEPIPSLDLNHLQDMPQDSSSLNFFHSLCFVGVIRRHFKHELHVLVHDLIDFPFTFPKISSRICSQSTIPISKLRNQRLREDTQQTQSLISVNISELKGTLPFLAYHLEF